MAASTLKPFVSVERISPYVHLDPAVFVLFLAITAWILYKLFLKELNPDRHRNLRGLFRNLWMHCAMAIGLYLGFDLLYSFAPEAPATQRIIPYVGLMALIWGTIVFIKTCRIFAFEYLFLINMQVGVPLLLVNLLTLVLSLLCGGWILSAVFEFQLVSLIATSAVLSIVLGMALQDTLGNLFAGVALQLDKPYAIGDWIEVLNGNQKVTGQVQEISWRATVLVSATDEIITIPNRTVAQSQVSNFSGKQGPVIRSQVFRISYGEDLAKVREALLVAAKATTGILARPKPVVFLSESTESFIIVKLIYYVEDFGSQFRITDAVLTASLEELSAAGISLASPRLTVTGMNSLNESAA